MKKNFPIILIFLSFLFGKDVVLAQNIGISTDGSVPETGVMLDIKGTRAKATTITQNVFQVKSDDASFQLKLRLILGANATATSMYGAIEVADSTGIGTVVYRHLSLQPNGGNVGIGTVAPTEILQVVGNSKLGGVMVYANQSSYIASDNNPAIYRTAGGGASYPFTSAGHLVLQPSTAAANKDLVLATGNGTPIERMVIQSAGNVGIGTNAPGASALLEIGDGTDSKGILLPRVSLTSTTDATTIASAATSLLVYNTNAAMTNGGVGFWYWDGTQWVRVLTGNNSTTVNSHCYTCDGF